MDADLSYETLRPLYPPDAPPRPYPGLERFVTERVNRDYAIGEGRPPTGAGLPGMTFEDEYEEGDEADDATSS
jgi:hypothetical protein